MIDREAIVDIAIKYDLSIEEIFILDLLYYRDWKNLYKYSNYTPLPNELRPNPNKKETANADGEVRTIPGEHGLPKRTGIVAGNRAVRAITGEAIADLMRRGFIEREIPESRNGSYQLDDFVLSEKFTADLCFDTDKCIDELYEVYPKTMLIDGSPKILIGEDRVIMGMMYTNLIKRNYKLHRQIVEKVKLNKDKIQMGIKKFITGKVWEALTLEAKIDMSVDV